MQQTRLQRGSIKSGQREREMQTSLQAQDTDSERLLSAASYVSDETRKGWLLLVTVTIEIAKWIRK